MHLFPYGSSIKLNTSCRIKQHFSAKEYWYVVGWGGKKWEDHRESTILPPHLSQQLSKGHKGWGKNISLDLQVALCLGKIVCTPIRCRVGSGGLQRASARSHCPPALVGWGKESEIKALYWGGKKISIWFDHTATGWSHRAIKIGSILKVHTTLAGEWVSLVLAWSTASFWQI